MKQKLLISLVLFGLIVAGYFIWMELQSDTSGTFIPTYTSPTTTTKPNVNDTGDSSESEQNMGIVEDGTYHNKKWGISFVLPKDWEVKENEINANSSLFNLVLNPTKSDSLPRPIYITLTSKEWGENLVERYYSDNSGTRVLVGGINTYRFKSSDMGIPTSAYLFPINDLYWINIVGKDTYETELKQVLDSLVVKTIADISAE